MTIQLTKDTYVAGVLSASGSQHTLDEQTESYLVHIGAATWVETAYTQGRFEDAKIEYDSDGVAVGVVGRANQVVGPVWQTNDSGNPTGLVGPNGENIHINGGPINTSAPPGVVFDACDATAGWTVTGTLAASALYPHSSATGSIKATTTVGTGARSSIITKTISKAFNASEQVVVWVYVPDATYMTHLYVFLSSDNFATKWMTADFVPRTNASGPKQFAVHTGWNALTINTAEFTANGGEAWTNTMTQIRLRSDFSFVASSSGDVYWAGVELRGQRKAKISFSFDNGHIEQYYAGAVDSIFDIFTLKRGIVGTLAMGGGPIDGTPASYMTTAQLQAFRDAGWDFASKGYANTGVFSGVADLAADMAQQTAWYASLGIVENGVVVAYGGDMTPTVAGILDTAGYSGARLYHPSVFALNRIVNGFANPWWVESIPLSSAVSIAAAQTHIDNAIAYGYSVVFTGHKVKAVADTESWTPADLATLADYAITKQNAGAASIVKLGDLFRIY